MRHAEVKKYTAYLIVLTKFKKEIGMKEKFEQNMEVPVSLMEFYPKTKGALVDFFVLNFTFYDGFWGNRTFKALSFDFLVIKLKIRMCFYECVSECVSANVFPICF